LLPRGKLPEAVDPRKKVLGFGLAESLAFRRLAGEGVVLIDVFSAEPKGRGVRENTMLILEHLVVEIVGHPGTRAECRAPQRTQQIKTPCSTHAGRRRVV